MNIGLFFGTFNPVHSGHTKIISNILQQKLFDQIWIILSPRSPHKKYNLVDKNERFHMLEIAFANYKKVIVSDVEFYLNEPNYTAITLDYLKKVNDYGVSRLIYTDIDRDGMKQSPNFDETMKVAEMSKCPVIISGGVSSIDDIKKAKKLENVGGIIVGKAIYDGDIKLEELVKEDA